MNEKIMALIEELLTDNRRIESEILSYTESIKWLKVDIKENNKRMKQLEAMLISE